MKLGKLAIDLDTQAAQYKVNTPGELLKLLDEHHAGHGFKRTTLMGWFDFSGVGKKPAYPVPKQTWLDGIATGHVSGLSKAPGRKLILQGAEETLQSFVHECTGMRTVGISIHVHAMRAILSSMLIADGHSALLSPHLLNSDAETDTSKFCCSDYWMYAFLDKRLGWTWRRGTKAAQ